MNSPSISGFDFVGLMELVHGLETQCVLEGSLNGQDGRPIDNEIITERRTEVVNFLIAELMMLTVRENVALSEIVDPKPPRIHG